MSCHVPQRFRQRFRLRLADRERGFLNQRGNAGMNSEQQAFDAR